MRRQRWFCLAACVLFACVTIGQARDARVSFLEERTKADADDFLAWNQLADRCLQLLRETGDDRWLRQAREAANASLKAIPAASNPGGLAVRARVALAEHRFADARKDAEQLVALEPGKSGALVILTDALLESGLLAAAEKTIAQLEELGAPALLVAARHARLAKLRGDHTAARTHYETAQAAAEESDAAFWTAWAHVQLGELAFSRGDWEGAEKHYAAALAKQPGWWTAQEHLAELRAAQERDAEALQLYAEIIARTPRAELLQAVGDLHLHRGRQDEAKTWHERALAAYLRAETEGAVSSFHHLAGFFCDSQRNAAEAERYARKDLELRDTAATRDALAWALYHAGKIEAARHEIERALAINSADPHVLHHAAMIRMSAGDIAGGRAALRKAAEINPRFQSFHVHR